MAQIPKKAKAAEPEKFSRSLRVARSVCQRFLVNACTPRHCVRIHRLRVRLKVFVDEIRGLLRLGSGSISHRAHAPGEDVASRFRGRLWPWPTWPAPRRDGASFPRALARSTLLLAAASRDFSTVVASTRRRCSASHNGRAARAASSVCCRATRRGSAAARNALASRRETVAASVWWDRQADNTLLLQKQEGVISVISTLSPVSCG